MIEVQNSLPFSEEKQDAMLGHLLTNDRFFVQARTKIQPSWFVNVYNAKIWAAKQNFYNKYQRTSTIPELKEETSIVQEDEATRKRIYNKLEHCISQVPNYGFDTIAPELTDWLHARIYHEMVDKSAGLFNKQHFQAAYSIVKERIKEIDNISFNNDNEVSFDNIEQDLKEEVFNRQNALTFGIKTMDRVLVPQMYGNEGEEIRTGGLLKGDCTILLAPTNIGKTAVKFTVIAHNILPPNDKSVLLFIHEDTESECKQKLLCAVLNWSRAQLFDGYKTKEGQEAIVFAQQIIKKNVTYIHNAKAGLKVEEVAQLAMKKQDERSAKSEYGFKGYDLFVDDYPAILSSEAIGAKWEKRNSDEYIYRHFIALANDIGWHSLISIQTNREGAKINAKVQGYQNRLLIPQDVSESWPVMCMADNVISLNRDEMDESNEILTFYVGKSRSNKKGIAVIAKSDYAHSRTHDDALGSTWYPGKSTMSSRVEALLSQYGKPGMECAIPLQELLV